jgi:hypothetical protein
VKTSRPADPRPRIHFDSVDDDRWTWRYVEEETGLELYSNETFSSRELAVEWARKAYPEVPFADEQD